MLLKTDPELTENTKMIGTMDLVTHTAPTLLLLSNYIVQNQVFICSGDFALDCITI